MQREETTRRSWVQHAMGVFALVHVLLVILVLLDETPFDKGPYGAPGRVWNRVHQGLDRTMRLYGALLGPKQGWGMFGAVSEQSAVLHLRIRTPRGYRLVYRERSEEADWNRLAFDHYRWREWMSELGKRETDDAHLQRFVDWVGPVLAAEELDACEVIATFRVADALQPEQLIAGEAHDLRRIRRRAIYHVPGRPCRP